MRTVLVPLASGAGPVRLENGLVLVTDEVDQGRGTYLRAAEPVSSAESRGWHLDGCRRALQADRGL
jgi:hypothetical protein